MKMFNTFVRPIVEYGTQVWSPYLLNDIDTIEKVQSSFTRRIPELRGLTYEQRLAKLSINSLEQNRILSDLVLGFKIIRNQIDIPFDEFFKYTTSHVSRSHNLRLKAPFAAANKHDNFFQFFDSRTREHTSRKHSNCTEPETVQSSAKKLRFF